MQSFIYYAPVTVAVDGSCLAFTQYVSGIFTASCGTMVNQNLLAVGYYTSPTCANGCYWIVQNSQGTGWGMSGYMYISMEGSGSQGVSGIYVSVLYPYVQVPA